MHLFWTDLNLKLRTARVVSKPESRFFPKRWEEREVPEPIDLAQLLASHPQSLDSPFVFPSPTGNREQKVLRRCKEVAARRARSLHLRSEDLPVDLCDEYAEIRVRYSDRAALNGPQVNRDHHAVSGARPGRA